MTQPEQTAADPVAHAPVTEGYLAAPEMPKAVASLAAQFALAAVKGTAITAQPDVSMRLIETLPEDLALLRTHVAGYFDSDALAGGVLAAMEAVRTMAEAVTDLAAELTPIAQRLDSADSGSQRGTDLATFREALDSLRTRVTALDPDGHSAALPLARAQAALADFAAGPLADDLTRLTTAARAVQDADVMHRLKSRIDDLQDTIDDLNEEVAQGATSQILNSIFFGLAIGGAAMSAESDPAAAVLGVAFAIKDEAEGASGFAAEMKQKNSDIDAAIGQYRELLEDLAAEEKEMAVLLTVSGHGERFTTGVQAAGQAVAGLLAQVRRLGDGIDDLSLLDSGSGRSDFYSRELSAAAASWTSVAQACTDQLTFVRGL